MSASTRPISATRMHASAIALASGAIACLALLAFKGWLAWRININWDEFYALTLVHEFHRGELKLPVQTLFAQGFVWLAALEADEVGQVVVARCAMTALMAVSCGLLWKLASRWTGRTTAVVAPLAYLSFAYVQTHGGAFRLDSLLTPLVLGTLVLASGDLARRRRAVWAGLLLGLSAAVTIKAVLLVPVLVVMALARRDRPLPSRMADLAWMGAIAVVAAVALLTFHALALGIRDPDVFFATIGESGRKTLTQDRLLTWRYFLASWRAEPMAWSVLFAGAALAATGRRYAALACGLSLLPLFFYRNAYPYYYTVMLAPACVLAALACAELKSILAALGRADAGRWGVACIALAFCAKAGLGLWGLRADRQANQRALVAAVHRVFPHPVSYVDHSGMIASFHKVNFFMSTWGLDRYRAEGRGFVRDALSRHRPPLLLANREVMQPGILAFKLKLLDEDKRLIEQFYQPYWGPIRVAGAKAQVGPVPVRVALPFPGRYRVVAPWPVEVNGRVRADGDEVTIAGETATLRRADALSETGRVSLLWAAAMPPPEAPPPGLPLYDRF